MAHNFLKKLKIIIFFLLFLKKLFILTILSMYKLSLLLKKSVENL